MDKFKRKILALIQRNSERKIGQLAGEYPRSKPEEREAIMAGIQFERDLADSCQMCLVDDEEC